jgi:prophage antirepressor-like protein
VISIGNELTVIEQREVLGKTFKIYGSLDDPLFLARDVAEWIEYDVSKSSRLVEAIDDETEKQTCSTFYGGQVRDMWFVTEDGLYEILMTSKKPIAKKFKKEVKVILRTIRKTGHYETPEYKAILELKANQEHLEKLLIDSGILRTNVNPRYTFDRLNVRYKIATCDDGVRGFYDAIGNYFGINVPYSNTINVTVKDWIIAKVDLDEIQEFVVGLETGMITKSLRGHYVNLNGFGGNNIE